MFWTNHLQNPQIERLALPSYRKITVVSENLNDILAITVEQEMDILLWSTRWSNKIEYTDLDGQRRAELYAETNLYPISLSTLSKYLFWVDKEKKNIEKVSLDLHTGRSKQTIFSKLSSLTDIISVALMKRNSSTMFCLVNIFNITDFFWGNISLGN